jgi:hypothetical protein
MIGAFARAIATENVPALHPPGIEVYSKIAKRS